jgi:5-methylcytosine-specific restriction endonuclease McrA
MRAPRLGSRWSRHRVARRARYADYIQSDAWWHTRQTWYAARTAELGRGEPCCAVCDAPWLLDRDDLHHKTYDRLGHEHLADLLPMCRACHTRLHDLWDTSPAWRKLGRARATAGIIAALRREHRQAMNAQ